MPTKREDSDIISQLFPDPEEPKDLETGITESLSEPISHDTNKREENCYCEKARNLNIVELLCAHCNRWFHESCIGHQLGKIVPFMMNYEFVCKNCSPSGLEIFKKTPALFSQLCVTALGNLMQQSVREGAPQTQFSSDKHIIPFIDRHWDSMTTTRRATRSWQSAVVRALVEETNVVFACNKTATNGNLYSLMDADLTQIKPDYEAVIEGVGHVKVTDMGEMQKGLKNRNSKRKMLGEGGTGVGKKGRGGETVEHPLNKDGYRYIMAEPDPHAPYRQEFDGSSDYAGKPIPGWLYRAISPVSVRLAVQDRAPQLKVSEDCSTVTGEKGYYGTIRATHYVSRGCWYWEAVVEAMPEGSATRLGWAQEYASLQPPLGFDKFGYSWRSRKGTRFHEGRGKHYSRGYGEGDVLGCMILLPDNNTHIPQTYKDRPLVKFKSNLYYEEKYQITERLKNLKPLPESKIIFFKNGECQGEAFSDISAGAYYPTVSIHKSAKVSVNFGPDFKYPPPAKDYNYRGFWEKAEEAVCEQTMADLLYLTENEGKLRLDASP